MQDMTMASEELPPATATARWLLIARRGELQNYVIEDIVVALQDGGDAFDPTVRLLVVAYVTIKATSFLEVYGQYRSRVFRDFGVDRLDDFVNDVLLRLLPLINRSPETEDAYALRVEFEKQAITIARRVSRLYSRDRSHVFMPEDELEKIEASQAQDPPSTEPMPTEEQIRAAAAATGNPKIIAMVDMCIEHVERCGKVPTKTKIAKCFEVSEGAVRKWFLRVGAQLRLSPN